MLTVGAALDEATRRLARAHVPDPRVNAEFLLAQLLATGRGGLLARRGECLGSVAARRFAEWIERRERREPAQHVTGEWEFYGLSLKTDRRALVPRQETELLVDVALRLGLPQGAHVADLGTGSGCIAIALAVRRPDLRLTAVDGSAAALSLARENAALHGVERHIDFVEGDFRHVPEHRREPMDLVVANPPYVSEADWAALEPEVRDHDPREALVAGPTGYEAHRALLPVAARWLRPGGRLLLELGAGQAEVVRELAAAAGWSEIELHADFQRIPRVLAARR